MDQTATEEMQVQDALCPHCRTKERDEKEMRDLVNRLKRIEGQIRGIRGMVEKDAYCVDILNQTAAAESALASFSRVLLETHIRTCVADDLREGSQDKVDELMQILKKMM